MLFREPEAGVANEPAIAQLPDGRMFLLIAADHFPDIRQETPYLVVKGTPAHSAVFFIVDDNCFLFV